MMNKKIKNQVFQLLDDTLDINNVFTNIEVISIKEVKDVISRLEISSDMYENTREQFIWIKKLFNTAKLSTVAMTNKDYMVYYDWSTNPKVAHDKLKNSMIFELYCIENNIESKYIGLNRVLRALLKEEEKMKYIH